MANHRWQWVLMVGVMAIAGQAQACRWAGGQLKPDGTPLLVNCKPDVERYVAREHQCHVAKQLKKKLPDFCDRLIDERAALYHAYMDTDDEVHLTVGTYLNSTAINKIAP